MDSRTIEKFSFAFFALIIVALMYFHLATPFITILFCYLALRSLSRICRKWLAIAILVVAIIVVLYGSINFFGHAIRVFPDVAARSIPLLADYASKIGIGLPFTDVHTLKNFMSEGLREQLTEIAKFAEVTTKEFIYLIIGLVVASSIFVGGVLDLGGHEIPNNAYSKFCDCIKTRFVRFYSSFQTVMGAQLIISGINTFFTALFVFSLGLFSYSLPYPALLVIVTFLCGVLPIIGNLISNSIIFAVAVTQSARLAIFCLVYLIILHKIEYFLNSKIIGGRIRNPMWLTLIGLLVGERIMGIPGMILAPVMLHYVRIESSKIEVTS